MVMTRRQSSNHPNGKVQGHQEPKRPDTLKLVLRWLISVTSRELCASSTLYKSVVMWHNLSQIFPSLCSNECLANMENSLIIVLENICISHFGLTYGFLLSRKLLLSICFWIWLSSIWFFATCPSLLVFCCLILSWWMEVSYVAEPQSWLPYPATWCWLFAKAVVFLYKLALLI